MDRDEPSVRSTDFGPRIADLCAAANAPAFAGALKGLAPGLSFGRGDN
jgi:hypothetical protein